MFWVDVQQISEEQFQRLPGVKRGTFLKMVEVLQESKAANRKHASRGRPCKLSMEDQLLMMRMYYREYRTFFHIALTYGISEVQCWRIVTQTERALLQSKAFSLPGKKRLHQGEGQHWQVVVVDVSEHPVQRPKKNNGHTIQVRRKGIR
jgi:Helix-turn-helix of DDE superfamily endonuclease